MQTPAALAPHTPQIETASVSQNSAARFAADILSLALGAAGTVVTTRTLGPTGQGVFAVLTLISTLTITICCLGLGEAAIVRVGSRSFSYSIAGGATLGGVLVSGSLGVIVAGGIAAIVVQPGSTNLWFAVLAMAIDVPVSVLVVTSGNLLNVREQIRKSSGIAVLLSLTTLLGLLLFVLALKLSVFGAVLAGVVASQVGLAVAVRWLLRSGLLVRPNLNFEYLRSALQYGLRSQLGAILTAASNRIDLLIVFLLRGRAAAGFYSVALTIGSVVTIVPYAVSYATFPRLASMEASEAAALAVKVWRLAGAAAAMTAAGLVPATVVVVPLVLGQRYAASTAPAAILIVGGIALSGQWILARAEAARGRPGVLVRSFAISSVIMVALDGLLVPLWSDVGAALASSLASVSGFAFALKSIRKTGTRAALFPTADDFRALAEVLARAFPRRIAGLRLVSRNPADDGKKR